MSDNENLGINQESQNIIKKLRLGLGNKDFNDFISLFKEEKNKPLKVVIIGKAGVGKTTTINALFNLAETVSHTDEGTTSASEKIFNFRDGGKLSVIDTPGLGSDIELDQKYIEICKKVLPEADVILYVIQSNLKAFEQDEENLKQLVTDVSSDLKGRIVVGLNQVDKISPGTWNIKFNRPSPEQEDNIDRRCCDIQEKLRKFLGINVEQIEYYSAAKRYRLYDLLTAIIKSTGKFGWKFPINPADPIELADESVRELLKKGLEN